MHEKSIVNEKTFIIFKKMFYSYICISLVCLYVTILRRNSWTKKTQIDCGKSLFLYLYIFREKERKEIIEVDKNNCRNVFFFYYMTNE